MVREVEGSARVDGCVQEPVGVRTSVLVGGIEPIVRMQDQVLDQNVAQSQLRNVGIEIGLSLS